MVRSKDGCLKCATLGKTKISLPTFQSRYTLTFKEPGTCSPEGGLCVGMNKMDGPNMESMLSALLHLSSDFCLNII